MCLIGPNATCVIVFINILILVYVLVILLCVFVIFTILFKYIFNYLEFIFISVKGLLILLLLI